MTVSEELTALMDKARELTGLNEKISIAQLTSLMSHFDLHANPNLLDTTTAISENGKNNQLPMWMAYSFNYVLKPGKYTFSWRAKADSNTNDGTVRVRILDARSNTVIPEQKIDDAGKVFPLTDELQSYTFSVPDDNHTYRVFVYGSSFPHPQLWSVTFYDCKLEFSDLATPLQTSNGPLSITCPDWNKADGWGSNVSVIVPVFKNVPIYATVEIKDIASTKSDKGPSLLCNYMDKNMNKLSYWDVDSNGNYKFTNDPVIQLTGDNFSNKNGLRSGYRVFNESTIRNVAYLSIGVGSNTVTTFSIRNLVVSYYKPYDFTSQGNINLLDFGQSYDTSVDKGDIKNVTGLDIDDWNKLIGKTITISYDLEWSNYKPVTNSYNRIGMEWHLKYESHKDTWANAWYWPQTSDGKEHVANTQTIPNDKIVEINSEDFYNQVNPECTFKATNFKIIVDSTEG